MWEFVKFFGSEFNVFFGTVMCFFRLEGGFVFCRGRGIFIKLVANKNLVQLEGGVAHAAKQWH
jgi:hypothetical protein